MADIAGWIQAGVAGTVAAVGTFFWAGSLDRAIADTRTHLEVVAQQQKEDHDNVTKLDVKLSDVRDDVAEIKADVKELVSRPRK